MEAATGDAQVPKANVKLPLSLNSGLRRAYRGLRELLPEIESNVELIIRDIGTVFSNYDGAALLNPVMLIIIHQIHRISPDNFDQRLETFLRWSVRISSLIGSGITRGALVLDFIRYDDLYNQLATAGTYLTQ